MGAQREGEDTRFPISHPQEETGSTRTVGHSARTLWFQPEAALIGVSASCPGSLKDLNHCRSSGNGASWSCRHTHVSQPEKALKRKSVYFCHLLKMFLEIDYYASIVHGQAPAFTPHTHTHTALSPRDSIGGMSTAVPTGESSEWLLP